MSELKARGGRQVPLDRWGQWVPRVKQAPKGWRVPKARQEPTAGAARRVPRVNPAQPAAPGELKVP